MALVRGCNKLALVASPTGMITHVSHMLVARYMDGSVVSFAKHGVRWIW